MDNKKEVGFFTIVMNLFEAYLKRLTDLAHLAGLEARLAFKTLITISLLFVVIFFLLSLSWISMLITLFLYLMSLHYSALFAALAVMLSNLITIAFITTYIFIIKKNLSFPATRNQLQRSSASTSSTEQKQDGSADEPITSTD